MKSQDDEFLMMSIAGIFGNNFVGLAHANTKVDRALRRKRAAFFNKVVLRNAKSHVTTLTPEKKLPVLIGSPDVDRFFRCFESIAYGLYFHENKTVFKGKVDMVFGFISYEDHDTNTFVDLIKKKSTLDERVLDVKGENPLVFQYQFFSPDELDFISLKLTFYGGTEVFISFQPEGRLIPFNLGFELMKSGKHITFRLNDEEFEFNVKNKP